jgi:hypothetical protein
VVPRRGVGADGQGGHVVRHEVNRAYPRLKREWPGTIIRAHLPYLKGFPDFLLLWGGRTLYAEVKWCPDVLQPKQAYYLDDLVAQGQPAAALGWDDDQGLWVVRTGEFLRWRVVPLRHLDGVSNLYLPRITSDVADLLTLRSN